MVTHTSTVAICHSELKCKQLWVVENPMEKGYLTTEPRS